MGTAIMKAEMFSRCSERQLLRKTISWAHLLSQSLQVATGQRARFKDCFSSLQLRRPVWDFPLDKEKMALGSKLGSPNSPKMGGVEGWWWCNPKYHTISESQGWWIFLTNGRLQRKGWNAHLLTCWRLESFTRLRPCSYDCAPFVTYQNNSEPVIQASMRFHEAVPRAAKISFASKGLRNSQTCGSCANLSNVGFRNPWSCCWCIPFWRRRRFLNLFFWVSTLHSLVTGSILFAAAFWIKTMATRQESSHSRLAAIRMNHQPVWRMQLTFRQEHNPVRRSSPRAFVLLHSHTSIQLWLAESQI